MPPKSLANEDSTQQGVEAGAVQPLSVPIQNVEVYRLLFTIENTLRELIIERLQTVAGPRWYKTRLPDDCLEKIKQGIERDRATRWTRNVPHHPLYYVDLADIRLIIQQKDNWDEVFRQIFPRTKELVTTDLMELEFVRNKVAHNRRATDADLDIVTAAHAKLSSVIGQAQVKGLSARYTIATTVVQDLTKLLRDTAIVFALVMRGQSFRRPDSWVAAAESWWWFDGLFLGAPIGRFEKLLTITDEASNLGRGPSDEFKRRLTVGYADARRDLEAAIQKWA